MASQITGKATVYSTVFFNILTMKHNSSTYRSFVRGIHQWPVDFPSKWPSNAENVSISGHLHANQPLACLSSFQRKTDGSPDISLQTDRFPEQIASHCRDFFRSAPKISNDYCGTFILRYFLAISGHFLEITHKANPTFHPWMRERRLARVKRFFRDSTVTVTLMFMSENSSHGYQLPSSWARKIFINEYYARLWPGSLRRQVIGMILDTEVGAVVCWSNITWYRWDRA